MNKFTCFLDFFHSLTFQSNNTVSEIAPAFILMKEIVGVVKCWCAMKDANLRRLGTIRILLFAPSIRLFIAS